MNPDLKKDSYISDTNTRLKLEECLRALCGAVVQRKKSFVIRYAINELWKKIKGGKKYKI